MVPVGGLVWPALRAVQIWGAGPGVGKTVFSTILCLSAGNRRPREHAIFLEPVSTGPLGETGHSHASSVFRKHAGDKAPKDRLLSRYVAHYDEPGNPHLSAAQTDKPLVQDSDLVAAVYRYASQFATDAPPNGSWLFCETFGGVHTPGPSGASQLDLYRPLRVPAILIGDPHLGGISSTISAFESLRIRGYDVDAVLLFENEEFRNHEYLTPYFEKFGIPCISVRPPPERYDDERKDRSVSYHYFDSIARSNHLKQLLRDMYKRHENRIKSFKKMPDEAHKIVWFPFAQQKLLTPDSITAIDSAYGDHLQAAFPNPPSFNRIDPRTIKKNTRQKTQTVRASHLRPTFDGSASWWSQGLGHGSPRLTLAAAYAAGRYGNVTSAEIIHEPALQLAKQLLLKLDNPRLSRVLYTDKGSTGIETAVKMAQRAARSRHGWAPTENLGILGLKGGCHGDTKDTMNGHWLDFPTIKMTDGHWVVAIPEDLGADSNDNATAAFQGLDEIFDLQARADSELAGSYSSYITRTLESLQKEGRKLGALLIEPVVLGAAGMKLVDPLFQRVLVDVVRSKPQLFAESAPTSDDSEDWSGLPVVFDEGFTGLYRLGRYSSAKFLGVDPDISINAKPVTGGIVPLVAVVASDSIFRCFENDDGNDALLHGQSYTAHPISCQVALESLEAMDEMEKDGSWCKFQSRWEAEDGLEAAAWSVWGQKFVEKVSMETDAVEGVWALGSVLAIHFRDAEDPAPRALQAELLGETSDLANSNVHCQVFGNVLYLMASQISELDTISWLEQRLLQSKTIGGDSFPEAQEEPEWLQAAEEEAEETRD